MPDRVKLRWLISGFIAYFAFMVFALPKASVLPYQVFVLCGVLNFVIIGAFVFGIRKVYLRMKGITAPQGMEVDAATAQRRMDFDCRRLKWLWVGAGTYFLIFLNGLRIGFAYIGQIPLVAVILAEVLNASILAVFLLEIRKIYRRIGPANSPTPLP